MLCFGLLHIQKITLGSAMFRTTLILALCAATSVQTAENSFVRQLTQPTRDFTKPEPSEANPAGTATAPRGAGPKAFSVPTPNLATSKEVDFKLGNALFRREWQPGQGVFSGLGPDYNARSCEQCHLNDGRGHPPMGPQDDAVSLLMKIGAPAAGLQTYLATLPDPTYGPQLQDFATHGAPEFQLQVSYAETTVVLSGGETASLRTPTYHIENLSRGPLQANTKLSPRVAPQMIGLGLIEAISAKDILALTDPDDTNQDGISGRANWAINVETGQKMLGRFGLKAASPTIRQQTAAAFANDIGISNTLIQNGTEPPEISATNFDFVAEYSAQLAVPARTGTADKTVLRGKQLFYQTGCIACHRPKFFTDKLPKRPELSALLIWPYSDFLLHDMGAGLADGFPEGVATGTEWRTPPLWGIGLSQDVSGHTTFLHDGRARNLLEAVLWHGGEAQAVQSQVVKMPPQDRAALIHFLNSL